MKILNVFWVEESRFCSRTIEISKLFREDEFYYLVFSEAQFALLNHKNCILCDSRNGKEKVAFINEIASSYDYLVFHGMCQPLLFLRFKKKIVRKIVWRTWGGDVGYDVRGFGIKALLKRIVNSLFYEKSKEMVLIGYANYVDLINIARHYKRIKLMHMPYASFDSHSILTSEAKRAGKCTRETVVLVGHSGHSEDNHISILRALSRFGDQDMKIVLPLNYGDIHYIESVVSEAFRLFPRENVSVIRTNIPYGEYARIIHHIDVAIFDGTISYALGNISIALFFRKKIYLNRRGLIATAFEQKNIPFRCVDELAFETFDDFKKPLVYDGADLAGMLPQPYAMQVADLLNIRSYLFDLLRKMYVGKARASD